VRSVFLHCGRPSPWCSRAYGERRRVICPRGTERSFFVSPCTRAGVNCCVLFSSEGIPKPKEAMFSDRRGCIEAAAGANSSVLNESVEVFSCKCAKSPSLG
jgi:hypothetical protein